MIHLLKKDFMCWETWCWAELTESELKTTYHLDEATCDCCVKAYEAEMYASED